MTATAPAQHAYSQQDLQRGSNTKTFISVVVLQLAAEHRLSLNDTVGHWLPGVVHGHGNDGGKITVRELLQHTSGLHNYTPPAPAGTTPTPTTSSSEWSSGR